jgi:hypothetical protein
MRVEQQAIATASSFACTDMWAWAQVVEQYDNDHDKALNAFEFMKLGEDLLYHHRKCARTLPSDSMPKLCEEANKRSEAIARHHSWKNPQHGLDGSVSTAEELSAVTAEALSRAFHAGAFMELTESLVAAYKCASC